MCYAVIRPHMRGWWDTVEIVLFGISKFDETAPLCFSCIYQYNEAVDRLC